MFWRYGLRFFDNGQLSIKYSIVYWNGLFARSELRPIEAEVKNRVVVLQVIRTYFQQSRSPFQSARKARRPRSLSGVQSRKLLIFEVDRPGIAKEIIWALQLYSISPSSTGSRGASNSSLNSRISITWAT